MRLRQLPWTAKRAVNGLRFREGRRALRHGVVPALEHQALLRALRPALVIDVGANRGQFSLDVRRAVPDARVVAFEPLSPEADRYRAIFGAMSSFELHEVALGVESGAFEFHVSSARDSSSLLPIGARQVEYFPGTGEVGIEQVAVRTLDSHFENVELSVPALLKLDVQGGELGVLQGGARTLGSFRWVFLEMSFVELYVGQPLADELVEALAGQGFRLVGVGRPSIRGGMPIQVDALFERR